MNLQNKWDMLNYENHKYNLKIAQHNINNGAPKTYPHLYFNPKKLQLELERFSEIQRENKSLLNKLVAIYKKGGRIDNKNEYKVKSLNTWKRQQEMIRISNDNQTIYNRLVNAQPVFTRNKLEDQYLINRRYGESISKFPTALDQRTIEQMKQMRKDIKKKVISTRTGKRHSKTDRENRRRARAIIALAVEKAKKEVKVETEAKERELQTQLEKRKKQLQWKQETEKWKMESQRWREAREQRIQLAKERQEMEMQQEKDAKLLQEEKQRTWQAKKKLEVMKWKLKKQEEEKKREECEENNKAKKVQGTNTGTKQDTGIKQDTKSLIKQDTGIKQATKSFIKQDTKSSIKQDTKSSITQDTKSSIKQDTKSLVKHTGRPSSTLNKNNDSRLVDGKAFVRERRGTIQQVNLNGISCEKVSSQAVARKNAGHQRRNAFQHADLNGKTSGKIIGKSVKKDPKIKLDLGTKTEIRRNDGKGDIIQKKERPKKSV